MKRILLVTLISFLGFQALQAQDMAQDDVTKETEKMIDKKTKILAEELGLTIKQQTEVENKLAEYHLHKKKLMKNSENMSKKQVEDRLIVLQNNKVREMSDILTDTQFGKYKKMLQESGNDE